MTMPELLKKERCRIEVQEKSRGVKSISMTVVIDFENKTNGPGRGQGDRIVRQTRHA